MRLSAFATLLLTAKLADARLLKSRVLQSHKDGVDLFDFKVTEDVKDTYGTRRPTSSPTTCEITCETDYDCPRICHKPNLYQDPVGTCVVRSVPTPTPPSPPTTPPPTVCICEDPSKIPDKCEVDILIDEMEIFVSASHELLAQWTRAAFHDAGTFDQTVSEGGANGCLMNHPPMRLQAENNFLDAPLNTLEAIKDFWIAHPDTCIDVSSADVLQFAIFFAVIRQSGVPGLTSSKRDVLRTGFLWGRPDEQNCDVSWTDNLPGFSTTASGGPIAGRCTMAGGEINEKMMNRNGFTAEEATALIGAHTIGLIRNTFGASLAGPWVTNGEDNATPNGPVFDNSYHGFLINTIVASDANTFGSNPLPSVAPFTQVFPDWFRDGPNDLDHLDTDVVLAFPSLNLAIHPHFDTFSTNFANDNAVFLNTFLAALKKMSALGVTSTLFQATECDDPCGGSDGLDLDDVLVLIKKLGNATAFADVATADIQERRKEEIDDLTKPVDGMDENDSGSTATRPTTVETKTTTRVGTKNNREP